MLLVIGAILGSLLVLGVAYRVSRRWSGPEGLGLLGRIVLMILAPTAALGAGLDRMAKMLPRSWSDHPDAKHPRHEDYWPRR